MNCIISSSSGARLAVEALLPAICCAMMTIEIWRLPNERDGWESMKGGSIICGPNSIMLLLWVMEGDEDLSHSFQGLVVFHPGIYRRRLVNMMNCASKLWMTNAGIKGNSSKYLVRKACDSADAWWFRENSHLLGNRWHLLNATIVSSHDSFSSVFSLLLLFIRSRVAGWLPVGKCQQRVARVEAWMLGGKSGGILISCTLFLR